MRNIWIITRRELAAYYKSTIGYVYMIVFLMVAIGLYITPFFTFPRADMRNFFMSLPVILSVFIPAITMRSWAEERKENTYELLLTFPMRPHELVLGKYVAGCIFYVLTLAATFTVPLMLSVLGDPDMGAIGAAYLGALLLGAFFLSMGIFFSGLCKDQIVAFILTLLACFGVYLIGTVFISAYLDSFWPGLGTALADLVGVTNHYGAFARGVVEMGDILYFVIWIALFLFLNGFYLEGRHRPRYRLIFSAAVGLCLAIGIVFNFLTSVRSLGRFDFTEDKIYTLSPASKTLLSELKVPVQVKVYITPRDKMPTELKSLEQDILAKLEEMRIASGSKVQYRAIHMEAANVLATGEEGAGETEESEEEAVEKRLLDKGVRPFSVRTLREDQSVTQLIYSSVGIAYKDKPEELLPQILPRDLYDLEYRLINTAYKLSREKDPVIALMAPVDDLNLSPQEIALYRQMGQRLPQTEDPYRTLHGILLQEKYDVRRVLLNPESPLPEAYDALLVINPRRLNERQRWEINRALVSGIPTLMAVQNYRWNYQMIRDKVNLEKVEESPGINEVLRVSGLTVDPSILMDQNHEGLTVTDPSNPLQTLLGGGVTLNLPTHIVVNSSAMNPDFSLTSRLGQVFFLWGSAITIDGEKTKENKLRVTRLIQTSRQAWKVPAGKELTQGDLEGPSDGKYVQYPVMVYVEGQFPDAFEGKGPPAWPKGETGSEPAGAPDEAEIQPAQPKPGRLFLVGGSQMFRRNFLTQGSLDLFLNAVDGLALREELIHIRAKKPVDRAIDRPSAASINLWKFVNLGLVNLVIALIGAGGAVVRRRRRELYTARYSHSY
jgi:ABC-type transport system involved in multi-copper enzyme maturation permease subunit/ABC-type uncharacterized transport system involved in gliding motility auxiliary subunit